MKDSKQLLDQVAQKIAASPNSSATPAGHPESAGKSTLNNEQKDQLANAINECFELLRINYQHLYFSAYPEVDAVNAAKRLWLDSLAGFAPDTVRQATHELIKQSDYLPTISRVLKQCSQISTGQHLPTAYDAYVEACHAHSPKENHEWTHPAIYYAGKQSNWRFLAENEERIAFPVFKEKYEALCAKVTAGEVLPAIETLALPETIAAPLSKTENAERMSALRKELNI